jgi:hypothetical protein
MHGAANQKPPFGGVTFLKNPFIPAQMVDHGKLSIRAAEDSVHLFQHQSRWVGWAGKG